VGGPCPEEDWFGSPHPPPPPSSPPLFSPLSSPPLVVPPVFLLIAFFLSFSLSLSLSLAVSANAARDDNERRNPAGISARDKRTLTAYEQASALMVPTLHRRPTGSLSLPLLPPFLSPWGPPSFPECPCCRFLLLSRIYRTADRRCLYLPSASTDDRYFSLGFLIKNIVKT